MPDQVVKTEFWLKYRIMKVVAIIVIYLFLTLPLAVYAQSDTVVNDNLMNFLLVLISLAVVLFSIYALSKAVESLSERLRERIRQ